MEFGERILVLRVISCSRGRRNGLAGECDTPRDPLHNSRGLLGDLLGIGNIGGISDLVGRRCSGVRVFRRRV